MAMTPAKHEKARKTYHASESQMPWQLRSTAPAVRWARRILHTLCSVFDQKCPDVLIRFLTQSEQLTFNATDTILINLRSGKHWMAANSDGFLVVTINESARK